MLTAATVILVFFLVELFESLVKLTEYIYVYTIGLYRDTSS